MCGLGNGLTVSGSTVTDVACGECPVGTFSDVEVRVGITTIMFMTYNG